MRGKLVVSIAKDMMSAEGYIVEGDVELTVSNVVDNLSSMGMQASVLKENVEAMLKCGEYNKTFIVAKGREPGKSIPGHYEFFVDVAGGKGPVVNEDGSVDFSKHRILVHQGDKIAQYHAAHSGTFGYTVYSTVIAPKPVTDNHMVCGEGIDKDGDIYFATMDGEVIISGDMMSVKNRLVISGNAKFGVDTNTEFNGDVLITGDVLTGVNIIAEGTIEVDGVCEACTLKAGKDIIIKGGVHGNSEALLEAKGSIYCPFIEEARVNADVDIHVDYMLNCDAFAKNALYIQGARGNVIGGRATAGNELIVDYAGNSAETDTILSVVNVDKNTMRNSKVVINKMIFPNTQILINGINYKGRVTRTGEFHLVDGIVRLYDIGDYNEIVIQEYKEEKKTVMLIDDEAMILKTFYSFLCDKYKVMLAASPDDALTQLNNRVPDLILLDYKMPVMDGGEFLQTIRKTTWKAYCNVPVIFVSAMTDKDIITKCLMLYPQGYLLKPLSRDELLDVVDKFFANVETENHIKMMGRN